MKTILTFLAGFTVALFVTVSALFCVISLAAIFGGMESNSLRYTVFAITIGCLMFWTGVAIKFLMSQGRNE